MKTSTTIARLASLLLMLALWIAPVIISATHGPGAMVMAAADQADAVWHGHFHGDDDAGLAGHDATDHEHPSHAVLAESPNAVAETGRKQTVFWHIVASGGVREGPERPPRV